MKKILPIAAVLTIVAIQASSADAIVFCHDYALHRALREREDPNNTDVGALRTRLTALGYKGFKFTTAAERPDAHQRLKEGDVIILGDAHSGYVRADHLIDHFIMIEGAAHVSRTPDMLPPPSTTRRGGLFRGDTITQMKNRSFVPFSGQIEVWRKH